MTTVNAAAAYFATLAVAFVAADVIPRSYLAASSPRAFKALIASFNNACEVELVASGAFATFRGTSATAEGVARYGYEVRRIAGDKYMAKRSRVGVRVGLVAVK